MEQLLKMVNCTQIKIRGKSVDEAITRFTSWYEANKNTIPEGMFSIIMAPKSDDGTYTVTITHKKK